MNTVFDLLAQHNCVMTRTAPKTITLSSYYRNLLSHLETSAGVIELIKSIRKTVADWSVCMVSFQFSWQHSTNAKFKYSHVPSILFVCLFSLIRTDKLDEMERNCGESKLPPNISHKLQHILDHICLLWKPNTATYLLFTGILSLTALVGPTLPKYFRFEIARKQ